MEEGRAGLVLKECFMRRMLLLAALVATFGFWGALKGILGAIGVIVLLCFLAVLTVSFLAAWLLRR